MKSLSLVVPLAFVAGLAMSLPSLAQQPAGTTGVCKDGSYTSAENKRGACRGHGGVKDWYGAAAKSEKTGTSAKSEKAANTAKSEKSATATKPEKTGASAKSEKSAMATPTPAPTPAATPSAPTPRTDKMASTSRAPKGMRSEAAPGGGAGKVWLNTATNTYHCSGDQWYGKTKAGEYMSEAEAKAKGGHAARGKVCS